MTIMISCSAVKSPYLWSSKPEMKLTREVPQNLQVNLTCDAETYSKMNKTSNDKKLSILEPTCFNCTPSCELYKKCKEATP